MKHYSTPVLPERDSKEVSDLKFEAAMADMQRQIDAYRQSRIFTPAPVTTEVAA